MFERKITWIILSVFSGLLATVVNATTFNLPDDKTQVVGHNLIVYSHHEDTLLDIARNFDLGYSEIVDANPGVDVWLPGEQQPVLVPNRFILPDLGPDETRQGLVLNLAEMRLFFYPKVEKGQRAQVITHPLGIGREGWTTPLGKTRIIQKKKDPTWTVPASILAEHEAKGDPLPRVVPAGPDNPLGAYAMRLAMPGYLIHGTNRPYGVGLRVSHGCLRMFPEDIEHLFGQVALNSPVEIIYEPNKATVENGVLYIESHEIQQDMEPEDRDKTTPMVTAIFNAMGRHLTEQEWPYVKHVLQDHKGVVQKFNQPSIKPVEGVWFLHAGLTDNAQKVLLDTLLDMHLEEYFWPFRQAAVGEHLIGPFESKDIADKIGAEISQESGLSIWTVQVEDDAL